MTTLLAMTIGALVASGVYLTLSNSLIRLVIGFNLIGHAVNLSVFILAGLSSTSISPIIAPNLETLPLDTMDPLPQALILTAIVIGFGLQALMAVLVYLLRVHYQTEETDALDCHHGGR